jgi:uncharacterized Zn finger protein
MAATFGWLGKGDARSARVREISVSADGVAARMRDARGGTAEPRISVEHLPRDVREKAVDAMARKASFAASLLSGRMPDDVETAFAATGRGLLPSSASEVRQSCTCGEEPFPCRHLVALHRHLAERLDRDPFLMFLLRGIDRDTLLRDLRRRRTVSQPRTPQRERPAPSVRLTPLPEVKPEHFYRPLLPLAAVLSPYAPPAPPDAILARLGPPPLEDADAARLLADLHRAIGIGAKERLAEWEWRKI